jgi:(R,R)-butanediol dehydrogenase/meso-butanediol dehydrogenase/diacetyl reductase
VVVECTGQTGMIDKAIQEVAPGGTVVVLGTCAVPDSFLPIAALAKEVAVRFSFMYDLDDYGFALEAMASGALAARAMITGHVGFDALPDTFEALRGRTSHCKVMIDPTIVAGNY